MKIDLAIRPVVPTISIRITHNQAIRFSSIVKEGSLRYRGRIEMNVKMMVIGGSGAGKTHVMATFPKVYALMTEPEGEITWECKPALKKNIVGVADLRPATNEELKDLFEKKLGESIATAKKLQQEGKVETLGIDNFTYLINNRWEYECQYNTQYSKQGEVNKLAMYAELGRWAYKFVLMSVLTFKGNVVVNCHEQMENEEALLRKPNSDNPIVPNIIGGFRNTAEGMFSLVVYLSKISRNGKLEYWARTNMGNRRNAKSRFPLPATLRDLSYKVIQESITKQQ